jgi:uncharacterized protein YjbJ (UPF0337 family)
VQLCELLAEPVDVCVHQNPVVVEGEAKAIRAYVAALIRAVESRAFPNSGDPATQTSKENPMNSTTMKGQWKEFKGKVKEKWGKLTNGDLDVIAGEKDQLVGRIQQRYGYEKERAQKEVDEFCNKC